MSTDRSMRDVRTVPPPDSPVLVVGNTFAAAIANHLSAETVRLLTDEERAVRRAGDDVDVLVGDPTNRQTLRRAIDPDGIVVVATVEDCRDLLISRLASVEGTAEVVAFVEDPENVGPFVDAGVSPVCTPHAAAAELVDTVRDGR